MDEYDFVNIKDLDDETSLLYDARLARLCRLAFDKNNFKIERL